MSTCELPLEERVTDALERHPHLSRRALSVEAEAGRVILRGKVSSYFEKQLAQEAVRRVDGIHHIDNELEVNWVGSNP